MVTLDDIMMTFFLNELNSKKFGADISESNFMPLNWIFTFCRLQCVLSEIISSYRSRIRQLFTIWRRYAIRRSCSAKIQDRKWFFAIVGTRLSVSLSVRASPRELKQWRQSLCCSNVSFFSLLLHYNYTKISATVTASFSCSHMLSRTCDSVICMTKYRPHTLIHQRDFIIDLNEF
jgi:hypothetical protein